MVLSVQKPIDLKRILLTEMMHGVWSNPKADFAGIIETNRITPVTGTVGYVLQLTSKVQLPTPNRRYVVVELGSLYTKFVGLNTVLKNCWYDISTLINNTNITILGFSQGRLISQEGCYLYVGSNNNVLIAIDYATNVPVIRANKPFYYKFYTNMAFSDVLPSSNIKMVTDTFKISAMPSSALNTFLDRINNIEIQTDIPPFVFVNGLFYPNGVNYATLSVGDIIQFIHDPYIISSNSHDILLLDGYESVMDEVNKHILSVDGDNNVYIDDIEIYVTGVNGQSNRVGVYFPRLKESDIRMLTYKDWAINSQVLSERASQLEQMFDVGDLSQLKIHVYRKTNAAQKKIILDKNHIADLMNLPAPVRKQALSGVQSVLPLWEANELEGSNYLRFITKELNQLNTNSINNVLSRAGVISLMDEVQWDAKNSTWTLPISAGENGGQLIRFSNTGLNPSANVFQSVNNRKLAYANGKGYEMFYPEFNLASPLDIVIPANTPGVVYVESGYGILCYYTVNDELVVAIRGTDYQVVVQNNNTKITWSNELMQYERYVRTANKTVIFTTNVNRNNLADGFDIYNGRQRAHDIGMGRSFVWCEGKYLVEGLDYTVSAGKVYVVSKPSFLNPNSDFFVIYTGLPDETLKHVPCDNWGWVEHGTILNDGFYDLLMYRNYHLFVNGKAVMLDTVVVQENYTDQDTQQLTTLIDGTPYALVDKPFLLDDVLLGAAIPPPQTLTNVTQSIKDYLSITYPQTADPNYVVIPEQYELISPLMDKIIEAIINGELDIDKPSYMDSEIYDKVAAYIHLLDSDPCIRNHNTNYVVISPRWDINVVNVNQQQYAFLTQVNRVLLFGQVQGLNQYVSII